MKLLILVCDEIERSYELPERSTFFFLVISYDQSSLICEIDGGNFLANSE